MKRNIIVAMVCVMLLSIMPVMAGGSNESSSSSDGKTVVRILTRFSNPGNPREKYFQDMVAKFNEENPDIDLQDLSISDEGSRDARFKTSIASGDPIEVFNFLGYAANLDYVRDGVVTDLAPEMEADPEWVAAYKDNLFGPVRYDDFGISGIYGMPIDPYGVCCFYNKAIFDELGIPLPETWEEIEAATPALLEAGYTPMAFGAMENYRGGHFYTALSMKAYGSEFKDALISGEEKWNGERAVELISYMKHLNDIGVFGKDNMAYNADGELSRLENKQAAIIFTGSWNLAAISAFSNADDIVCMGFPYFEAIPEHKDDWMGGPDCFISISSKPADPDYEATLRVLKYFTSYDYLKGQYEYCNGSGTYPVTFEETISADRLTDEFNSYYSVATNMIGEIEQYDAMASLIDIVRTNLQTIFTGAEPQAIGDAIQLEVDNWQAMNNF